MELRRINAKMEDEGKVTGMAYASGLERPPPQEGHAKDANNNDEVIAIVGMAMKLPGSVRTADEFWDLMVSKKSGRIAVPPDRYNVDAFYHAAGRPGSVCTHQGHFLQEEVASFDREFFAIHEHEAAMMDPQQRMLLEVVWECLENAGQTQWRGQEIGCFVGSFGENWLDLSSRDLQRPRENQVNTTMDFALANRVSYTFDLKGPSFTIQTACSSSLVALHTACQAISDGQCRAAIVAGVNLIMSPTLTIAMTQEGVLSSDGISKTFDAAADGYGRGEAVSAIFLKKMDDAVGDNDPVRAIVRATATNFDGKTSDMKTPNPLSHERLIRHAYAQAGISDFSQTAFVECHGTGTATGDPLEAQAIANVFGHKGVTITSVKPNVGHSEGASALSSIIKAILSLEHKQIPPNIHFETPNPRIPFEAARLHVPRDLVAWPADRDERVSINAFGIGGVNAHAILESAPRMLQHKPASSCGEDAQLLILSAHTPKAVKTKAQQLVEYLGDHPERLRDVAYTLSERREHLKCRAFHVVLDGAVSVLSPVESVSATHRTPTFVFTGQGAQWVGMGRDLLARSDTCRASIANLDKALQALPDAPRWKIADQISQDSDSSQASAPALSQTLTTALQIGLVDVLAEWGIRPACVVGHSSGEIAAAYAAGALTAEAAIAVAYYRGQVADQVSRCHHRGGMAAVGLSRDAVASYLSGDVTLACENSPDSVTISGDKRTLENVVKQIQADHPDTFCRFLRVDVAYHSRHMRTVGAKYEALLGSHVRSAAPAIPLYSSVTGAMIRHSGEMDARYWRKNLESPVLFLSAISSLLDRQDIGVMIEVGPHPALAGPVQEILAHKGTQDGIRYLPTLSRHKSQLLSLMSVAGSLQSLGLDVDLAAVNQGYDGRRVVTNLPLYPWQHETKHWDESRVTREWRLRVYPNHELLGSRVYDTGHLEPVWRNVLRLDDVPWLRDHQIGGQIIFPCSAYIAIAGEAIRQLAAGPMGFRLRGVCIQQGLVLTETKETEIITSFKPLRLTDELDSLWWTFTISSCSSSNSWIRHVTGEAQAASEPADPGKQSAVGCFARIVPASVWYRGTQNLGMHYGPRFQCLKEINADPVTARAAAMIHDVANPYDNPYYIHPATIDQLMVLCAAAACHGIPRKIENALIPQAIGEVYVRSGHSTQFAEASATQAGCGTIHGTVNALVDGVSVLHISGLRMKPTEVGEEYGETDTLAAVEPSWCPLIDLFPHDQLIRSQSNRGYKLLVEKLAVLCTIEGARATESSPAGAESYPQRKFRAWLSSQTKRFQAGEYPVLADAQRWVEMEPSVRQRTIGELADEIMRTPNAPYAQAILSIHNNLADILAGRLHALEVLSKHDCLTNIYQTVGDSMELKDFFNAYGRSRPYLRVLEIGAGTGGMTAAALGALTLPGAIRLYGSYTFTDISPGFFSAAMKKFEGYEGIEYQALDISRDPVEQGFTPAQYDLIIAANVLHATPSLRGTLSNVRKLLAPGGSIFLQEVCGDLIAQSYIMGSLPGWWLGESDGRIESPYVSAARWDEELKHTGFSGAEIVVYDDEKPFQQMSHIISKGAEARHTKEVVLVFDPPMGDFEKKVARAFESKGYVVSWCMLGQPLPTGQGVVFLCETQRPLFHDITAENWACIQGYLSTLQATGAGALWVTVRTQAKCSYPEYGMVLGLLRTVRTETSIDCATLEVPQFDESVVVTVVGVFDTFQSRRELRAPHLDYEYVLLDGTVYVARYLPLRLKEKLRSAPRRDAPKILSMEKRGLLDTLHWAETETQQLASNMVEVRPLVMGLNFRDLLTAMGIVDDAPSTMGIEASGLVTKTGDRVSNLKVGDRVMLLIGGGSFASIIQTTDEKCIKIPDELSLEEAATMPCVFSTAIYALVNLARVVNGQTVLIHSASGGLGQAAIQICQHVGATIYATVGDSTKADFLEETYGIPREWIFSSRNAAFLPAIMQQTDGRGVDIVLNSLSGELLHASWRCVAKYGCMLELGKRDILGNARLSMNEFLLNRSFIGVDMAQIIKEKPSLTYRLLDHCLALYKAGSIRGIEPIHAFDAATVQKAFRRMQGGASIGKIIIRAPDDHFLSLGRAHAQVKLSPDRSYLLIGGLGGIGRPIATWLVENGARHLVFFSRSAGESANDRAFFKELMAQGTSVTHIKGDVSRLEDVERIEGCSPAPIGGIFQMAMVLKDCPTLEMGYADWNIAVTPKVSGTWNIHQVFKDSHLDFLVLMSSIAGIRGYPGQANYAAANSFLNGFAHYRHARGLCCSVINLGVVDEVGFVARNPFVLQRFREQGTHILTIRDLVNTIHLAVRHQHPAGDSDPRAHSSTHLHVGFMSTHNASRPGIREDVRLRLTRRTKLQSGEVQGASEGPLREFLSSVAADNSVLDSEAGLQVLRASITRMFCSLLSMQEEDFDPGRSVASLGMDSLVKIEVRRWWRRHLGLDISIFDIANAPSVNSLTEFAREALAVRFGGGEKCRN